MTGLQIEEARKTYGAQLKAYQEKKLTLQKQKKELEAKRNTTPDGEERFAEEAAVLELTMQALEEKQSEYQEYMDKLTEQWVAAANVVVAKQQGEAMSEAVEDLGKIMEVARRIMKGGVVPQTDEKKLMDYNPDLYQMAKSIGAAAKQREKEHYKSLWEEEEPKETEDPTETANQMEACGGEPDIVSVEETVASVSTESGVDFGIK